MMEFLKRHGQMLLNIYLFLVLGGYLGWESLRDYRAGKLDYVETAFIVQNAIFVTFILIRQRHQAVDRNVFHQAVAVVAFFSGVFFVGEESTGGPRINQLSAGIIFTANVFGAVTLINLGRSIGILIARREIKSGGLYGFVRHPMYGTDILLRVGFLISHFEPRVIALFIASTACYVWRAMLEERFLSQAPEYRDYRARVRYRFIPGVF